MLKVVSFHHIIRHEYPGHPADYIVNFYIILNYLYSNILQMTTYICKFAGIWLFNYNVACGFFP